MQNVDDEDKQSLLEHISHSEWEKERLIWIAFDKNSKNDKCLFPLLPKDIVLAIITFFKTDLRLDNFTRTDYRDYGDDDQELISNKKGRNDVDVGNNNVENNDKIDNDEKNKS